MPDRVRVEVDERAVKLLAGSDEARDMLMDYAEPIVRRAQLLAPKSTGAGAASIRAEPVHDGFAWAVRISWTRGTYYMVFHDQGTQHIRARQFLEAALEGEL